MLIFFLSAGQRDDTSAGEMLGAWLLIAFIALLVYDWSNEEGHDDTLGTLGCIAGAVIGFSIFMAIFMGFGYLMKSA